MIKFLAESFSPSGSKRILPNNSWKILEFFFVLVNCKIEISSSSSFEICQKTLTWASVEKYFVQPCFGSDWIKNNYFEKGDAVAELSKALLYKEKIKLKSNDTRFLTGMGNFYKLFWIFLTKLDLQLKSLDGSLSEEVTRS